jgi:hypothetical protein
MKAELAVVEAVVASGRSKTTIYRWIEDGLLRPIDSSEGTLVRLD